MQKHSSTVYIQCFSNKDFIFFGFNNYFLLYIISV